MTQFTNFNASFPNQNANLQSFYNFNAQNLTERNYYVQEPHGKRPFPAEFEADMEYVPRTKRRFEKISACLENFSISNEKPSQVNFFRDSSDEEMEEIVPETEYREPVASTSSPLVVEPDDEPAVTKKIRLDETVQRYLQKCRQDHAIFLPKPSKLKGTEMVLWQPAVLVSPRNDFNMAGRIQEIDDEEEERVNEKIKERIIENEGMIDSDSSDVITGIVELDPESEHSDIGSSWSSPIPSPTGTGTSQIVELGSNSPHSLTNGSVSDEEMMEFDD